MTRVPKRRQLLKGIERHFTALENRRQHILSIWSCLCSDVFGLVTAGIFTDLSVEDLNPVISSVSASLLKYKRASLYWTQDSADAHGLGKALAARNAFTNFQGLVSVSAFNKTNLEEALNRFNDKDAAHGFFRALMVARACDISETNNFQQLGLATHVLAQWLAGRERVSESDLCELSQFVTELNFAIGLAAEALPAFGPGQLPETVYCKFRAVRNEVTRLSDALELIGRFVQFERTLEALATDLADVVVQEWRLCEEQLRVCNLSLYRCDDA
jgi:hypothetical protein